MFRNFFYDFEVIQGGIIDVENASYNYSLV